MKVLHIDAAITGANSVTAQLSAAIVAALRDANDGVTVARRDLDAAPIPHLNSTSLGNIRPAPGVDVAATADAAILREFLDADIVVIGAPMYNFSVPSQLKAWIDRVLVAGKTFRYTAQGPEGLAGGKTVIVASSRGGMYGPETGRAAADFQEPYLRAVFGFIGIKDITIVRAEGIAMGAEQKEAAVKAALAAIPAVVTQVAPAVAA